MIDCGRLAFSKNRAADSDNSWEISLKTQGEIEFATCKGMTSFEQECSFEQEFMDRGLKILQAHLIKDRLARTTG